VDTVYIMYVCMAYISYPRICIVCLICCILFHLSLFRPVACFYPITVQKRAVSWPQDLDGEVRFVEFYVVSDFSQVIMKPVVLLSRTYAAVYIVR